MPISLRTQRLVLRRLRAADLDALGALFGDPEVMRHVGSRRQPWTREETREALERAAAHWHTHGFGSLAVVERTGGVLVGECGLQLLEDGPDIELTYTLARAFWGRGYATEAAAAALEWGFGTLRLARIVGVAYPENADSQRVLEKVGMHRVGVRRCYGAELVEFAAERLAGPGASAPGTPPAILTA